MPALFSHGNVALSHQETGRIGKAEVGVELEKDWSGEKQLGESGIAASL